MARESIKVIAERIGKSYQSVYREVARNSKPDGSYQPWFAHNQAHLRRRRPKARLLDIDNGLRAAVAGKLGKAVVTGSDQLVVAASLAPESGVASLCRDDLRSGVSRIARRDQPANSADWSYP